jgi:glycosyltransferase involved in cell wall biosynthesis
VNPRLAIFTANMDGGGAERAMAKLAGGMAGRGYEVDLVLSKAVGHYLPEVSRDVRVVDLGAGRVLSSLPGLVRYLRSERPSAMLTSLAHVNVVGLWARRVARVETTLVVNEQNTFSLETRNSTRRRHRYLPRLTRRFYPWADAIVAVSQGAADDLALTSGLAPERIQVVHNPIVTPQLRRMVARPLGHAWFEPGEPPVVLAVGRLSPQKDFPTLIRAFGRIRERREARLLILGGGPERRRLESLTGDLGLDKDVALPGWVTNPYPYMRRAAAFVLSSRWEGLPSVLIEALYCGPPVIATDCPSGPVEILEGGRHGRLAPVGDVDAIAQGIEDALEGGIARPTEASWRPYEQETVVDRYLDVLRVGGR